MAAQGPRYPGTAASLANAGTSENANAWLTPSNIGADDATEAQITAATFDSPDISEILVASNFGFTIPAGSTIDGITVEIDRRGFTSANSGKDNRVQLATGTTFADLVGANKAAADIWQASPGVKSYGGVADTWTAGLTAAQVNAAGFAVFLSAFANVANADIGVDYIRVTVNYTLVPVSVTPGTASLTTTLFAPTVSAPRLVTPGVASLTTSRFTPTVTATNNVTVRPGVASLSLTAFTPTVLAPRLVTPGVAALSLTAFAPTVAAPRLVTPGVAILTLTAFVPTVTTTAGGGATATPGTAALVLTAFAPTVLAPRLVTPGTGGLVLTGYVPLVLAPRLVTPGVASLVTTRFAPTVTVAVAGGEVNAGHPPELFPYYQLPKLKKAAHSKPEI